MKKKKENKEKQNIKHKEMCTLKKNEEREKERKKERKKKRVKDIEKR